MKWMIGGWDGAAAKLGLSRTTLISRMQRLGIAARNAVAVERARHPAFQRTVRERAACWRTECGECPALIAAEREM
jgi:hypothetical protein